MKSQPGGQLSTSGGRGEGPVEEVQGCVKGRLEATGKSSCFFPGDSGEPLMIPDCGNYRPHTHTGWGGRH